MLGKVVSGMIGSRIAEKSGQSGALGAVAGLVASRIAKRSPIGALMIGGAWVAHKLYRHNQQRQDDLRASNAKPVKPARAPQASPHPAE